MNGRKEREKKERRKCASNLMADFRELQFLVCNYQYLTGKITFWENHGVERILVHLPTIFTEWQWQMREYSWYFSVFSLFFWEMAFSMDVPSVYSWVLSFPCTPSVIPNILCQKLKKRSLTFVALHWWSSLHSQWEILLQK